MYLTIPSEFIYSKVIFSIIAHFTPIWTTAGRGRVPSKNWNAKRYFALGMGSCVSNPHRVLAPPPHVKWNPIQTWSISTNWFENRKFLKPSNEAVEQIIRMNFFQEIEILILNGDFEIELRKERKKENKQDSQ